MLTYVSNDVKVKKAGILGPAYLHILIQDPDCFYLIDEPITTQNDVMVSM